MQFVCKCRRADDQRAVCLRGIHDFVVGADDRALVAIFSCQPLDHLVGTLASLGVNDVNSRTMLPVFDRLSPKTSEEPPPTQPTTQGILNSRFALALVVCSMSSYERSGRIAASCLATCWTNAGSFRFPRWGTGVR